jgi:hypothetical protein
MRRIFASFGFFLFTLVVTSQIQAEQRGLVVVPVKDGSGVSSETLYKRSYALVIGIDDYSNGWPHLSGAVADAVAVADELKKRFGASNVTLLTSKNRKLTKDVLRRQITRFLLSSAHSHPDVGLLIWFAGHGHSVPILGATDEHIAYLVGADAPVPPKRPQDDYTADAAFLDKAIPLSFFKIWMRQTRAKHVLAVFDSCFSGGIFTTRATNHNYVIERATTLQVRQFISSGQAEEEVSDDGQFRKRFLDAITGRDPNADFNRDGYILGSELGQYLYQKITASSYGRQTPKYGTLLRPPFDRGDFVFRVLKTKVSQESETISAPIAPEVGVNGTIRADIIPSLQVTEVQVLLARAGYDPGPADGVLGKRTQNAIRAFQKKRGLSADGRISVGLVLSLSDYVQNRQKRITTSSPKTSNSAFIPLKRKQRPDATPSPKPDRVCVTFNNKLICE